MDDIIDEIANYLHTELKIANPNAKFRKILSYVGLRQRMIE